MSDTKQVKEGKIVDSSKKNRQIIAVSILGGVALLTIIALILVIIFLR